MKVHLLVISTLLFSSNVFAEKTLQECIDNDNDIERLACYDSIFGLSKNNAVTNHNENSFGSEKLKNQKRNDVEAITDVAIGKYSNWEKGTIVKLENGQRWRVIDSNSIYHKVQNPIVKIAKGALGSYFLSFEDISSKVKVTRVK